MGRASASSAAKKSSEPDVVERKRLKKLAFSNNLLSEAPAKAHSPLAPSKTVLKHHGKDILRKSQRKNRFLFSFSGLLAPIASGGKIGDLKDLGTKNPILYLHFPQGQMKLFGTIVYPKNRYLTLQFSRGGKNVMCEDNFDSMIVFSEVWWIGTKEENPEEARLDFPKEMLEGQEKQVECDFKGGAGGTSVIKQPVNPSARKYEEEESPETELESDSSDDKKFLKDLKETTPIRQSGRNAGKKFKFTEVYSDDDSGENLAADMAEEEEEEEGKKVKTITGSTIVHDLHNDSSVGGDHVSPEIQAHATLETKSKMLSESATSVTASNKNSHPNRGSLVQATISTLFSKASGKKKVEEKNETKNSMISSSSSKRKIDQAAEPRKKGKATKGEKNGSGTEEKKEVYEVEDDDDDIEDFSSSPQDTEESDEDWAA